MTTIEKYNENVMKTYKQQEIVIVKGSNATCFDENNKEYIDLGSGIGVNSLGYADKDWVDAVSKQASTLQHVSNLYCSKPMADLSYTLCKKSGYSNVFLANSGAESNECAIKIARKYSFNKYGENRNKILSLKNSFHGRTLTTLSATGQDAFHTNFFPFTEGFAFAEANNIEDVKEKLKNNDFCAVIFEFIQGEGGVVPLKYDFVQDLFNYCTENDILLIADEVQTGIFRTGKLFAYEHFNVKPNLVSTAKGLGGGLPIGGVLADEKTKDVFGYSDHGSTFGGNPVASAGACVVLEKISNLSEEILEKSEYIKKELSSLDEVVSIDGIGLMLGIELKTKKATDILTKCLENGVIILTAKEKIRLLPPLTITKLELEKAINILKKELGE